MNHPRSTTAMLWSHELFISCITFFKTRAFAVALPLHNTKLCLCKWLVIVIHVYYTGWLFILPSNTRLALGLIDFSKSFSQTM